MILRQASHDQEPQNPQEEGLPHAQGLSLEALATCLGFDVKLRFLGFVGFGVRGLGFRALGFGVQGLGFRIQGLRFRGWGLHAKNGRSSEQCCGNCRVRICGLSLCENRCLVLGSSFPHRTRMPLCPARSKACPKS